MGGVVVLVGGSRFGLDFFTSCDLDCFILNEKFRWRIRLMIDCICVRWHDLNP